MKILNKDVNEIRKAVLQAERHTSGEIVPVILKKVTSICMPTIFLH